MTIKVKLPRSATGQEIIDAFTGAATFEESQTCRWRTQHFCDGAGIATIDNPYIPMCGVDAFPTYLTQRGWWDRHINNLSDAVWCPEWNDSRHASRRGQTYDRQIRLLPLLPSEVYQEAELLVMGEFSEGTNASSTRGGSILSAYKHIVQALFAGLSPL